MSTSMTNDTYVDVERACAIWQEYQREHDVSGRIGMTAGIDPVTGHVWFGDSIPDVVARMDEGGEGLHSALLCACWP